jgi:hypothetical protein
MVTIALELILKRCLIFASETSCKSSWYLTNLQESAYVENKLQKRVETLAAEKLALQREKEDLKCQVGACLLHKRLLLHGSSLIQGHSFSLYIKALKFIALESIEIAASRITCFRTMNIAFV